MMFNVHRRSVMLSSISRLLSKLRPSENIKVTPQQPSQRDNESKFCNLIVPIQISETPKAYYQL